MQGHVVYRLMKLLRRIIPIGFVAALAVGLGVYAGVANAAATGDYQSCTAPSQWSADPCGSAAYGTSVADVRGTHSTSDFSWEFTAYNSLGVKIGGPYGPWARSGYHYGTAVTVPSGTAYIVYNHVFNNSAINPDTFWTCSGTVCSGPTP